MKAPPKPAADVLGLQKLPWDGQIPAHESFPGHSSKPAD